jgi:hypothetical protein
MAQRPSGVPILATRLKHLRESRWPGRPVKQVELARALGGLAASTISSWENISTPAAPPEYRLRAVATFFATERSVRNGVPRVLPDDELTDEERAARDELHQELLGLRSSITGLSSPRATSDTADRRAWYFPDRIAIRLICGKRDNPVTELPPGEELNRNDLEEFADLDALVELLGHIRMENPNSDVQYRRADRLVEDDLAAHLVLIGGVYLNRALRWMTENVDLPVAQVDDPRVKGGDVFVVGDQRFLPRFSEAGLGLIEDVGLFVRMPHPSNSAATLSICNGVFTTGAYGAVRCLTDAQLRDQNEDYLATAFAGGSRFGVLMRVPVLERKVVTPDLSNPDNRLYKWAS